MKTSLPNWTLWIAKSFDLSVTFGCIFLLAGCQKEAVLEWKPQIITPVIYGKLNINAQASIHHIPVNIVFSPDLEMSPESVVVPFDGKTAPPKSYTITEPRVIEFMADTALLAARFRNPYQFPISQGMEITIRNAGETVPLMKHRTRKQIEPNEIYDFMEQSQGIIVKPALEILVENIGSPGSAGKVVKGNNNPCELSLDISFPTINYVIYPSNQSQKFSTETKINVGENLEDGIRELTVMIENRMPVSIATEISLLDDNRKKITSATGSPILLPPGVSQKSFKISDPEIISSFKHTHFALVEGSFQTGSETYKISKEDLISYKIIANASPKL